MALVSPQSRGNLVWDTAQRLARPAQGSFDVLLTFDAPQDANEPLDRIFDGIDSTQTRLVVLDPRRWTLLNGRDSDSRDDIAALFGLGPRALHVDNAASCVVACVNTQRRESALKRAAEVLAWRHVIGQLTDDTEDELREARRAHDELVIKLERDVARAYQHYAYLVRTDQELHVEYQRFDEDNRTALNGGHLWAALVQRGRATQPGGLSSSYLEALLDTFDRDLTPREIVQAFYKNPTFPLVTSTDEIRHVLFDLLSGGRWQLVDVDDNPLVVTSAGQISIQSITQRLRRQSSSAEPRPTDDETPPDDGTTDGENRDTGGHSPVAYKRYRIQLMNKSITGADTRDQAWQLARELAKTLDPAITADHQLLTLDLTLVTASGDQGAIEAKAAALGARVDIEEDDF